MTQSLEFQRAEFYSIEGMVSRLREALSFDIDNPMADSLYFRQGRGFRPPKFSQGEKYGKTLCDI